MEKSQGKAQSGRVFSYDRVSHSTQQKGGGLARQSDMAAAWCKRHGLVLDTELQLSDPGRSAYKGHNISRGALGRFIALAKRGALGPDPKLIVETLDRLSRAEPLDALDDLLLELVKRCGVTVITLEDGQVYSRETLRDDPMALVRLALSAQAAYQYSARLSRRLSAHWQQVTDRQRQGKAVARGRGGMKPFWLDPSPSGDEWLLNTAAPGVARLYELLLSEGLTVAADRLNAEGHLCAKGRPWDVSSVRRVASDPAAMGTLERFRTAHDQSKRDHRRWLEAKTEAEAAGALFNAPEPVIRELVHLPAYYPAVVTTEQWAAVQAAMAGRDHNAGGNRGRTIGSPLQGLIQCQGGGAMGITTSKIKSTGESVRYFSCRNRRRRQPCTCVGTGWREKYVVANVLSRLSEHLLRQAVIPGEDRRAELARIQQQVAAAQDAEQQAQAAVAAAQAMLEQATDGGSLSAVEAVTGVLEKRQVALRKAQAATAGHQQQLAMTEATALPVHSLGDTAGQQLLRAVHRGEAPDADLLRLREVLRLSQLRVVLRGTGDSRSVGIRFGVGDDFDWQPLDGQARSVAAWMGMTQPANVNEKDGGNFVHVGREPITPQIAEHIAIAEQEALKRTGTRRAH